jgi:hypothetical protein
MLIGLFLFFSFDLQRNKKDRDRDREIYEASRMYMKRKDTLRWVKRNVAVLAFCIARSGVPHAEESGRHSVVHFVLKA